jgi:ABC-type phosphate transport system substrate-binding protein
MTRLTRMAATLVVAAGGLLAARSAHAQDAGVQDCTTLTNPIFLTGSSAFEPTVKAFAVKLSASTETTPATVVYQKPGSCVGVAAIGGNTDLTGTASYYTLAADGTTITTNTCQLPSAGTKADVGISDVFYESCTNVTPTSRPPTLGDFRGPVQAMEFIVPKLDTSTVYITAAEAQDIWGCGASAGIGGFTMMGGIFCRDGNSGTQIIVSDNIGLVPTVPAPPICVSEGSSGALYGAVEAFAATHSIGFVGADVYDTQRANLNALAFQAVGQSFAYYADSSSGAVDRQNVRDGHYTPWGYEHLFTPVDATNTPTDAKAARFINLITGATTDPSFDYIQVEGKAGTIPLCAMSVQKTNDSPGYLSRFDNSADPCSCAYVKAASGTAPASCVACGGATDGGVDGGASCTGGKSCHHGFCE